MINKIAGRNKIVYEVIEANTGPELSETLYRYLAAGYKLQGGVSVVNIVKDGEVLQAMYQAVTYKEKS